MRKKIFLAAACLLFTTSFVGCKKEDQASKPLKEKMVGRWSVVKIETTTGNSAPVTISGTASDYYDFKEGEDDIVEINVGNKHQFGTYVVLTSDDFNISIDKELYRYTTTLFDGENFEFTGTSSGSISNVNQKVYLKR